MYLFNKQEQLINVKGEHDFTEIHLVEKINTASQLTFSVVNPIAQNIQKVCVPAPRGAGFLMFKIITEDIKNDHIEYTCVESAYDELASYGYIRDLRPSSRSAEYILKEVLKETRWRLGTVYNTNNVSTNFYYEPILNCIQDVVSLFDLELTFTVAITGNKIVKRQVNMYSQQGERTGKRFEYGSNALEVEQETSTDELYTALVGRGKGEEVEGDHSDGSPTGYGRRITFADVVWKKSNGDALDKPKGQEYLEDPEATKLYGFADGSPRIGIVTFEDDTDKRLLLNHTYEKLLELERPQVRFKASVLDVGDLGLGDTVAIIRHDFHIEYFTRVFKVDHDLLDKNNNTIELGDDLSGNDIGSQVNDISNSISSMHQQISYVMAGASSDNQKVTYSPDQPADGSLGDLWYKDLGNGQTEMYIYNDGWQLVVDSSGTNQEVLDKVDQAMQEMADKEKEINANLELQKIDISQAQADIEQARQDAANSVADIRSQVAKDVADAKVQSKEALDKANTVDAKATEALTNAEQAANDAKEAQSTTATIKTDVDTVKGQLSSKADKTTVDDLTKTVSSNSTSITQNAKDIKTKANSSTVDTLAGKVTDAETSISQNATDIKSKADKSTVDTLNQTVKNQGTSITQNSNAIKSKASSSDVDKLSGRVSTAETTLTQTAQGLAGKADTTQLNKLSGDLTTLSNNFSTTSAGFNASLSKIDDKVDANKEETDSALSVAKADIKATADNLSTNYTKTTDEHNYVNSQIKQSADKINLSVASVSDKVDANQTDTDSKIAALQIVDDQIKSTVSNKADTSYVDQKAGEISSTVGKQINDIQIGGRNYFAVVNWNDITQKYQDSFNGGIYDLPILGLEPSTQYTISTNLNASDNGHTSHVFAMLSKDEAPSSGHNGLSKGNPRTVIVGKNGVLIIGIRTSVGTPFDGSAKVQVEIGSKATDWTPALEDVDGKIDNNAASISKVNQKADSISSTVASNQSTNNAKLSNLEQNLSGFKSTVYSKSDIDGKVNTINGDVNKKANSSDVNNQLAKKADVSQITQLSDRINLKVSQTDFDNSIEHRNYLTNTYDGIKRISTTNSRGYMTELQRDITGFATGKTLTYSMWHKASTHTGYLCVQVDGTSFHSNTCKFNSYEWLSVTFSVPKDVKEVKILGFIYGEKFDGTNTLDYKREKLEIGKVATDWSPSPEDAAKKNELVSQINIDKSGVLIQGKKIMIDGDATIKNAVIKSSMIDTLDASKITAGTLNAANVNIINMNANNITTGTLRGTNLSMNLNTGEVLFQKGSIKSANGKLNISINNGTMSVTNSNNEGIYFKDGRMMLSNTEPFNNQNLAYGLISYEIPGLLDGGLTITGYQGALLTATNKKITASSFNNNHPWFRDSFGNLNSYGGFVDGSGVAVRENDVVVGSGRGRVDISGGDGFATVGQPHIEVGTSSWNDNGFFNDKKGVGKGIAMYAYGIDLATSYNIVAHTKKFVVFGDFTVSGGKKNAVVPTSQGDVAIDAYETAEYYFGDIGTLNTGEAGYAKVIIDSLFNETVNTSIPYHVFTTAYEDSYIWVTDRTSTSFIVHSSKPNVNVSYEIKAKRLGYEGDRLEIQEGV